MRCRRHLQQLLIGLLVLKDACAVLYASVWYEVVMPWQRTRHSTLFRRLTLGPWALASALSLLYVVQIHLWLLLGVLVKPRQSLPRFILILTPT